MQIVESIAFEVIELEQLSNVAGGMDSFSSMGEDSSCVSQCHIDGNNEPGTT
ncbi:hypothetical protein N9W89_11225 [Hellea sp.]|nr:hypothetical protein [Hellea sp.]